jgi:CSLREA domain-containing protein
MGGSRRWGGALAAVLLGLACVLVSPAAAGAKLFTVDSTADDPDAAPDGICLTAGGECTLRAALLESNGSPFELDEIAFDLELFDGQVDGTIALASSLPTIVAPVFVNGRICPTAAGVDGPCVGIDGPSGAPALIVQGTEGVEIAGLAVAGAQTGIKAEAAERFKVQGTWFGLELDGDASGNTTGVFVGPGSPASRIGGEGPEAGNVFANNPGEALHIHGAVNARVLGNRFGVAPDGVTPAANGENVEVTSVSGGAEATGTLIGTRVNDASVASAACDGGCNVISGAASTGVDLEGDGGSEAPATTTTIAGNYIGLDVTGAGAIPNASTGIRVGKAALTVVGGPKAGDVNRINGGGTGVTAGTAAGDLVVRGNLIGVDSTGTESLAPPGEGIVVNSQGLSSRAVEALIIDNVVSAVGVAIFQRSFGATISSNEIFGAEIGIRTFAVSPHGNRIEGNAVKGVELNGILIENNANEVFGNEVFDAAGAGIKLLGSSPNGVKENLIGGNAPERENVVIGSGGAAIEIVNVEKPLAQNEVARNQGDANGGLFIDLVAFNPETELKGPHSGIEPPAFASATQTGAAGSAQVGARVRLFAKAGTDVGEVQSFLGEAFADENGNWEVVYDDPIPAGSVIAATQTSVAGGTSELSMAVVPAEPDDQIGTGGGDGGPPAPSPSSPSSDRAPQTQIIRASKRKSKRRTMRFWFRSNERDVQFQCKLDSEPFRSCGSPKKYGQLSPGKHVFKVRAMDPAGNLDRSPAKRTFAVLRGAGQ